GDRPPRTPPPTASRRAALWTAHWRGARSRRPSATWPPDTPPERCRSIPSSTAPTPDRAQPDEPPSLRPWRRGRRRSGRVRTGIRADPSRSLQTGRGARVGPRLVGIGPLADGFRGTQRGFEPVQRGDDRAMSLGPGQVEGNEGPRSAPP